ncbi:MAG: bifunctional folylpolyglutamate synthase/dihydrofolate synthase [Bacillus sp. (in: firmicutes)]
MLTKIDDLYEYLAKREQRFGMNFGLERMEELLAGLDVRHESLKFVHLAGTNGKGSTLHYLKKILMESGYKVGTFTSPHIESVRERIMIGDECIPEADFLRLFNCVMAYIEDMEQEQVFPTQFEILTVIALMYFQEQQPDLVLMETGLGGRLDSTNVITSLLSIITSISRDHTNILGNSISGIAAEKAGIIKPNTQVVTAVRNGEALPVIREKAHEKGSSLYVLGEDFHVEKKEAKHNGELFSYSFGDEQMKDVMISMLGKHQADNASLAITAASLLQQHHGFTVSEDALRTGLLKANWKGRLETVSEQPHIIIDGSHNEEGIRALIDTLQARYSDKKIIFLTAALADKDVSTMMAMIEEVADHIICTQFTMDRALSADKLAAHCNKVPARVITDWETAVEEGMKMMEDDALFVVTGSLYFLYYTRPYIQNKLGRTKTGITR